MALEATRPHSCCARHLWHSILRSRWICRVRWARTGAPDCPQPVTDHYAKELVKAYIPEEEHELLQLRVELLNA